MPPRRGVQALVGAGARRVARAMGSAEAAWAQVQAGGQAQRSPAPPRGAGLGGRGGCGWRSPRGSEA
eukprot:4929033-Lingulodinium_polyedra.AAC.1